MPALIFDCDGVLADTERDGHRPAFNETFAEVGLPVQWSEEEYGDKLRIGGGKERMASLLTDEFVAANGLPADAEGQRELLADWHRRKTATYKAIVRAGRLPARRGIARIVDEALDAGWTLAVASTSAEESVRAVLEHAVGEANAARFAVFAGDVVPGQEARPGDLPAGARAARASAPGDAIVIEDSRNGLLAAVGAGLRCVVTVSSYTAEEDMSEAVLVVSSLGDPGDPARVLANRGAARARRAGRRSPISTPAAPNPYPTRRPHERDALSQAELVVRVIAQTAVDNEKYFCELDAVVGDGDFGYSLARGFEVVARPTGTTMEYSDVGGLLKKTAIVLTKRIGGTSGPIWGTAFLRAGGALGDNAGPSGEEVDRRAAGRDRGDQAARQRRPRRQDAARRARPGRRRARSGAARGSRPWRSERAAVKARDERRGDQRHACPARAGLLHRRAQPRLARRRRDRRSR